MAGPSEETLRFIISVRDELSGKVAGIRRQVDGLGRSAGGLGGAFRAASGVILGVMRSISAAIIAVIARLGAMTAAVLGIVSIGAIGATLVKAVNAAAGFGEAMAEVFTIFRGSEEDRAKLTSDVKEISAAFATAPVDTAKALYDVISAGFTDAADAATVLNAASALAVGGATDQKTAFLGLNAAMQAYQLGADRAAGVSDLLFRTVEKGLTTVGALGTALPRVAALAAQAGVSLQELLGSVAFITARGISTDETVTQLRGLLQALSNGAQRAKELEKQFGIKVDFNPATLSAKGLLDMLGDVAAQIRTLDVNAQGSALRILIESIEGQNAFRILTGDIEGAKGALAGVSDSAGSTQRALEIMMDTTSFKMKSLKSAIALTFTEIGEALEPALGPALDMLTEAVFRFRDMVVQNADQIGATFQSILPGAVALGEGIFTTAIFATAGIVALVQNIANAGPMVGAFGDLASSNFELIGGRVSQLSSLWDAFRALVGVVASSFGANMQLIIVAVKEGEAGFSAWIVGIRDGWAIMIASIRLQFAEFMSYIFAEFRDFLGRMAAMLGAFPLFDGLTEGLNGQIAALDSAIDRESDKIARLQNQLAGLGSGSAPQSKNIGIENLRMAIELEEQAAREFARFDKIMLDQRDVSATVAAAKDAAKAARSAFASEFSQFGGEVKVDFSRNLAGLREFQREFSTFLGGIDNVDAATAHQAGEAQQSLEELRLAIEGVASTSGGLEQSTEGVRGFLRGLSEGFSEVTKSMLDTFSKGKQAAANLASTLGEGMTVAVGELMNGVRDVQSIMDDHVFGVADFDLEGALPALLAFREQYAAILASMDQADTAAASEAAASIARLDELIARLRQLEAETQRLRTGWQGFFGGFSSGFQQAYEEMSDTFSFGEQSARQLMTTISDGLVGAITAISNGTATAKDAFRDFAVSVLQQIQQIITKMMVLIAMTRAIEGLGLANSQLGQAFSASTGMSFSGSSGGGLGQAIGGGVISAGIKGLLGMFGLFDSGGIATQPMVARLAQNSVPEAVVPLSGGRRIPVELRNKGSKAETSAAAEDSGGAPVVQFFIQALDPKGVKEVLIEQRPTIEGMIVSAMSQSGRMKQAVKQAAELTGG